MKSSKLTPFKKVIAVSICVAIIASIGIVSCNKGNDSIADSENLGTNSVKFKSNEWPTFTLTKQQISSLLNGDISRQFLVKINSDKSDPKNSMSLAFYQDDTNFGKIFQDNKKVVIPNDKIIFGNNVFDIQIILKYSQLNGNWLDNFDFLRIIPIESTRYPGYLAYQLAACDKNGNMLQMTMTEGGDESNPAPPFCEPCASGYHCCTVGCQPNHPGQPHPPQQ